MQGLTWIFPATNRSRLRGTVTERQQPTASPIVLLSVTSRLWVGVCVAHLCVGWDDEGAHGREAFQSFQKQDPGAESCFYSFVVGGT